MSKAKGKPEQRKEWMVWGWRKADGTVLGFDYPNPPQLAATRADARMCREAGEHIVRVRVTVEVVGGH